MTQGQRKGHVALWLIVGVLALTGLVLSVIWRPPVPVQDGVLPGVLIDSGAGQDAHGEKP